MSLLSQSVEGMDLTDLYLTYSQLKEKQFILLRTAVNVLIRANA
ncbi:hypothetical protein JTT01_11120 [Clostridium botulinum]|nr:hypothetical protein [Clostridium botulinum]MCS4464445.1 hypothetical protein [Clostridium botulinum]MCS4469183.1 hypothetical protein [Clostridium botulinum]MCS4477887.1 hypothetical protein [Clostridium botulinum]MCS4523190.1 hypothetical protein [Clostridium botulinum]